MSAIERALVIGGGIGGLTAAIALRRAGIDVDLVEIKRDWSVYGVGIIQPNNTLRALDRIGLAEICVERGAAFPGWRIYDESNNFLMAAPASSTASPAHPPINGITRPIFHQILTQAALDAAVNARLGTTLSAAREESGTVHVKFTDGTEARFDLVVAADGIHSTRRSALFGDAAAPRFTGQAVWRYNLPRPPGMEWGELYFGAGAKVGLVPLSPSLMYMFLVTAESGNPRIVPDDLAVSMRHHLRQYSGRVAELREQITDAAAVVYRPMEAILLAPPWYKGRQIIIGDAAHATTPHLAQGAAMAIEDAVLLGELLARHSALEGAMVEFMSRRFGRAKFVVESSNQIAAWELEQWNGVVNPEARPGQLLHEATLELMKDF